MANHIKHPHTTETILWGKPPLVYAEQYFFPCLCLFAEMWELGPHTTAHHVELQHLAETKLWGKPLLGSAEQCLFYDFFRIYAGLPQTRELKL